MKKTHSSAFSSVYTRQPALSPDGKKLAFASGGDIWVVAARGGTARRITSHIDNDVTPVFSPDGRRLAFCSYRSGNGAIFIKDLDSLEPPRQITFEDGPVSLYCWAPDGQSIYFSSDYQGLGLALYKVGLNAATPLPVLSEPYESIYNAAISPDNKLLAFNNNGGRWWRKGPDPGGRSDIWLKEIDSSRQPKRLTHYAGRNLKPMWHKNAGKLFFLSDRGGIENIWLMPLDGDKKARQVTQFKEGRLMRPAISMNGKTIVFERDFQIWRLDTDSGKSAAIPIKMSVDEKDNPVWHYQYTSGIDGYTLAPDNKKVAFLLRGNIFADLADKGDKIKKGGDSHAISNGSSRESQLCWTPDSNKIFYISDRSGNSEIFLYDFFEKRERRISDSPAKKSHPVVSPDGTKLAYFADNSEIRMLDLSENFQDRCLKKDLYLHRIPLPAKPCWSPDSRWLAYIASDEQLFRNVYLLEIDSGDCHQVTFLSNRIASGLKWAPNGQYIVFNTGHFQERQIARIDLKPIAPVFQEDDFAKLFEKESASENGAEKKENNGNGEAPKPAPEPVNIVFEGIKERLRFFGNMRNFPEVLAISPDSRFIVYRAWINGSFNFWSAPMEEQHLGEPHRQLSFSSRNKWGTQFTSDGKRLYYLTGGRLFYIGIEEDGSRKKSPVYISLPANIEVDFHQEKLQIFNEAWQLIREHFYDPALHGCDWQEVRETFMPIIQSVNTHSDFLELLNLMLGELNASHLGATFHRHEKRLDSYLGLLFDEKRLAASGEYRIQAILPNSPVTMLDDAPQIGEYLLQIDGVSMDTSVNLAQLLKRKAGKKVLITLNKKNREKGARTLAVSPVNAWRYQNLQYDDWVRRNRSYVDRHSHSRLGYLHIRRMHYQNYLKFIADLDSENYRRDGVIIDVRFNPGGNIAAFILDILHRKAYSRSVYRGRMQTNDTYYSGNRIFEKPVILITNEHSGSNAEMFSEGFRKLGLGKVVGMPTAGAVIWTSSITLLDGTSFRLPHTAVETLDNENIEGEGRPVDIKVDRKIGESARGKDRQLDAAIKELLKDIDETG